MPETAVCFREVAVYAHLSLDRTEAAISLVSEFEARRETPAAIASEITLDSFPVAAIQDPITLFAGETVLVQSATIPRVRLWHPGGLGPRPRYLARLSLLRQDDGAVLDRRESPFGVRQVDDIVGDEIPPVLTVNGRRVPVAGVSWIPGYGGARSVLLARRVGLNLLRVTGGAEEDEFYEACDDLGVMVCQEVPRDAGAAGDLVRRLRHHPCILFWSLPEGGGRASSALRQDSEELAEMTATEDPQRPLIPAPAAVDWEAFFPQSLFGATANPQARKLAVSIGMQQLIEERRRSRGGVGLLPLCFPVAAEVARALAPLHVSAAFRTFDWSGETHFQADVWLHNDGEEDRSLLNVVARVTDLTGNELYQENLAGEVAGVSRESVGDLCWRFPPGFASPFVLTLEVIDEEGESPARSAYYHSRAPAPALAPFLEAAETLRRVREWLRGGEDEQGSGEDD